MGHFTDDRGAWLLLFHHGNQVLHALRNSTRQGPERRRCCRCHANANANEWSGVVELRHPLEHTGGTKELRALLAQSFDLESEDIKILHWARLH